MCVYSSSRRTLMAPHPTGPNGSVNGWPRPPQTFEWRKHCSRTFSIACLDLGIQSTRNIIMWYSKIMYK